jgi:hypothetical protein
LDSKLAAAIFAAQDAMPDLIKDSTNPHFKNTYISLDRVLETVLPVLREHGLMLTQAPDMAGPTPALTTRLTHVETGESFESQAPLVLERETPQAVGSAITYMRRYSILSILGLTADEDDDGEAASATVGRKSAAPGSSGKSAEDKKALW